ncbi:MAG: hypothetical protein AAB930_04115 [Patescibacteria group bacterium]
MRTAVDVIRRIVSANNLPFLSFDVYQPKGWHDGTIKHFKDEKKPGQRRNPKNAVEHSGPSGPVTLRHEQILEDDLNQIMTDLPADSALQVISPTILDTKVVHIPMLDIELPPNEENLSYLISCLRALGEKEGAILLSGASYHYYGYNLMTPDQWQKFMYKSLLLDEVVDTRWIGHRLLDGIALLRITPKSGYDFSPYVVAEI